MQEPSSHLFSPAPTHFCIFGVVSDSTGRSFLGNCVRLWATIFFFIRFSSEYKNSSSRSYWSLIPFSEKTGILYYNIYRIIIFIVLFEDYRVLFHWVNIKSNIFTGAEVTSEIYIYFWCSRCEIKLIIDKKRRNFLFI